MVTADGTFLVTTGFDSESEIRPHIDGGAALTVARPSDHAFSQAVHVAVPLGAAGILVALSPDLVRATFSSRESVLRVAVGAGGWILFSRLVRRLIPEARVRTVVKAGVAALLLWLNVGPYFRDDVKIAGSFPESLPTGGGSPGSSDRRTPASGDAHPRTSAQPLQLTSRRFRGLAGHRGSGEASVFRQKDGSHVVAFRDLAVSSVPSPVVYLVPGENQERPDGAIRLGRFDPRRDSYEVPNGADLTTPLTALIWCQRFAVPVAGATQSPV